MTSNIGEFSSDDSNNEEFARIAFGALANDMGVVALRQVLSMGRERIRQDQPGLVYIDEDETRNIVVRGHRVDFTVVPFGTHHLSHEVADNIIEEISPANSTAIEQ